MSLRMEGIYILEYRKNISLKFPEISAIRRVVRLVLYYSIFDVDIWICTERKAAISKHSSVVNNTTLYLMK